MGITGSPGWECRHILASAIMSVPDRLAAALAARYRIEREIGAGGMATVYLAHDLKHDRRVALKVLRPELAAVLGGDRFLIEIKTTAQLQHPHILPLFDSGTADTFLYYVMPYVEGETLRDKLNRETQLGIAEAVAITTDVADALDYAHRHGVIHRDIKPENILLHDGRPLVADFGIALALSAAAGGRMTETGLSLGTPHYMSPEQATAEKNITSRADIYSLGSVLYEMLTGEPPHLGTTAQQIIMKIVTEEAASVTKLRKAVPPNIAMAVGKALEKLPADRFDTAKAFASALANPAFATPRTPALTQVSSPWWRWRAAEGGPVLGAVAVFALAAGWMVGRRGAALEPGTGWSISVLLPDSLQLDPVPATSEGVPTLALSPDGSLLVFVASRGKESQLFLRRMSDFSVHPLEGTAGGSEPFFSPTGNEVAFFGAHMEVERVALADGRVTPFAANGLDPWGGAWLPDGRMVIARDRATQLLVLSASGDSLRAFACPMGCSFPEPLQDGRRVLVSGFDGPHIVDLDDGRSAPLLRWEPRDSDDLLPAMMPRLDGAGRLVFAGPDGQVFAAPFDGGRARFLGPPAPLAEGMRVENSRGVAQLAVSRAGVLAYAPGTVMSLGILVRADRAGKLDTIPLPPARYSALELSPDGRRIAAAITTGFSDVTLEVIDAVSGQVTPWLTGRGYGRPRWTADGHRLVVTRAGTTLIGNPDLSDPPKPLALSPMLADAHPMADPAAYRAWIGDTLVIEYVDGRPARRIVGQFTVAASSPDDRWILSEETQNGTSSLVARALDGSGRRLVIAGGGRFGMAAWAAGGHEFIVADEERVRAGPDLGKQGQGFYAVSYDPANRERPFGGPRLLFVAVCEDFPGQNYGVGMGGDRFVFKQHLEAPPLREVRVIGDWPRRLTGVGPR